jgi:uncharacterized iron-regulated protein
MFGEADARAYAPCESSMISNRRAPMWFAVLVSIAYGCASRSGAAAAGPTLTGTAGKAGDAWASPLHREHPLVGRIWDVRQSRWVDLEALEAAVSRADFVLLGETHDNPDHHLLEATLVRAIASGGRRPAVGFEMIDTEQQARVDSALARAPGDPDAVAEAVGWARSGWPDFALYRPVFAAALEAGLPLFAANLARERAHDVVAHGTAALAPRVGEILDRAGPLPEELARALREEMAESHCGQLPESMLEPMVLMQRARDAQLAERLLHAGKTSGAVLVAGAGHVRSDRGVPAYLAREAPPKTSLAVAFLEVSPQKRQPDDYGDGFGARTLPFDYVVFTPAAAREDPCLRLRRHHPRGVPRPQTTI